MRSARPFDSKDEGFHSTYQGQLAYTEINEETSPRAAFTTSWRNENFGVLFGLAGVNSKSTTEGYETIGWSNMNLSAAQCGTATAAPCDTIGGNNINVPATVPVGAGAGLVAGTVVDAAFLQANNPNATLQQIGDGGPNRLRGYQAMRSSLVGDLEWVRTVHRVAPERDFLALSEAFSI